MRTEFAWLVESKDTSKGVYYLTLRHDVPGFWTTDVDKALRFARRQDAEDYVGFWDDEGVSRAVEHGWPHDDDE